jgi:hypothetical protein
MILGKGTIAESEAMPPPLMRPNCAAWGLTLIVRGGDELAIAWMAAASARRSTTPETTLDGCRAQAIEGHSA